MLVWSPVTKEYAGLGFYRGLGPMHTLGTWIPAYLAVGLVASALAARSQPWWPAAALAVSIPWAVISYGATGFRDPAGSALASAAAIVLIATLTAAGRLGWRRITAPQTTVETKR